MFQPPSTISPANKSGLVVNAGRGRPRNILAKSFKSGLDVNGLYLELLQDRTSWRQLIYVIDPSADLDL